MDDQDRKALTKIRGTLELLLGQVEGILEREKEADKSRIDRIHEILKNEGTITSSKFRRIMGISWRDKAIKRMEEFAQQHKQYRVMKSRTHPFPLTIINLEHVRYKHLKKEQDRLLDQKQRLIDYYRKNKGVDIPFEKAASTLFKGEEVDLYKLHLEFLKDSRIHSIKRVSEGFGVPRENVKNVYVYVGGENG
jgi:hypothetical protein